MTGLGDLIVRVGANISDFKSVMGDVSKEINKTISDSSRAFSGFERLGGVLKGVGTQMTAAITLPIVGAGLAATKLAGDFDAAMRGVASVIGSDVSKEKLQALNDQTLALARNMGIDAVDAANALKLAIGTGISEDNALEFLRVASIGAIGGLTETSTVVDALTTVLAAYGLKAADAKTVTDKMAEAVRFGKGEFGDLAASIGPAAAQAKNMGISLDELLVAVGTLSVTSGGMSEAVTQVASAMRGLNQLSPAMKEALHSMGFESGEAAVKALGLTGTLQGLAEKTGGSTAAFGELFGRQEAVSAALGLTGVKAETVSGNMQAMTHAVEGSGASMRAFEINNASTNRELEKVKNQLVAVAIEMGSALLPAVNDLLVAARPLITMLSDAVKWFSGLPEPVKTAALGMIALTAAVGPVTYAVGQLLSTFGLASKAITIFIDIAAKLTASQGLPAVGNQILTLSTKTLPGLTAALGIAGAAFAGWKIGEWIANMQKANTSADNLKLGIERMGSTMKQGLLTAEQYAKALENAGRHINESAMGSNAAEQNLRRMEGTAKMLGVSVSRAGLSVAEYTKKLQEAISKTQTFSGAVAKASDELAGHSLTTAADAAAESVIGLYDVLVQTTPELISLADGTQTASDDLGDIVTATEDAGDAMGTFKTTSNRAAEEIAPKWQKASQQISTIISDMGKSFANGIIKLFDNSANEKLDEQVQALRDSLDERTQAWGDYQAGVAEKLKGIQEDYTASLLEQKTSFDAFVDEQISKRDEIRAKHAEELASEVKDLRDSLAEKESQYSDYVDEVGRKIEESKANHAEQLARELDDLRTNLRDKIEAYNDYVDEANTKLKRVGEDTSNSIADEQRSTKRKIDDKKKQYDRDAADTQKRIDKLVRDNKSGNAEEIADLQESLRRKAADRDEYIRREEEDLADYIEEQRLREQRQTDDIKEQLDQRGRDHQQAVTEIEDREKEATKKHSEAIIKETADLKAGLDERTALIEKARIDTEAKIGAVTKKHQDELAIQNAAIQKAIDDRALQYEKDRAKAEEAFKKQTDALTGELAKQAAEYDKYKSTIEGKLKTLEDAHKGPLQRIGDMFKDVFKGAGEALLRFAGEEVMGQLFKQLSGLLTQIPVIGTALGGIFGGTSTKVPTVPTTSPTSGSGGGGGSSVPMDPIGWGIAIAAGITQGLQMARQEGTLNAIEQHTKVTAITLAGIALPWESVPEGQKTMIGSIFALETTMGNIQTWLKGDLLPAVKGVIATLVDVIKPILMDIDQVLHVMMIPSGSGGAGATSDQAAALLAYSTFSNTQIVTAFGEFKLKLEDVKNGIVAGLASELRLLRSAIESGTSQLKGEINSFNNGLRDKLDDIFRPFGKFSDILNSIGGGGGGGGIGGIVGNLGSFASSMTTGIVSGITGLFKKGDSDRLDLIANATTYLAVAFGEMGLFNSLVGMANNIAAFVTAQSGWVHDAWVELLGKAEHLDALKWYADDTHRRIGDIREYAYNSMRSLQDLNAAAKGPPLTINVTGYVGDRDALIAEIKRQFGSALALQGT